MPKKKKQARGGRVNKKRLRDDPSLGRSSYVRGGHPVVGLVDEVKYYDHDEPDSGSKTYREEDYKLGTWVNPPGDSTGSTANIDRDHLSNFELDTEPFPGSRPVTVEEFGKFVVEMLSFTGPLRAQQQGFADAVMGRLKKSEMREYKSGYALGECIRDLYQWQHLLFEDATLPSLKRAPGLWDSPMSDPLEDISRWHAEFKAKPVSGPVTIGTPTTSPGVVGALGGGPHTHTSAPAPVASHYTVTSTGIVRTA